MIRPVAVVLAVLVPLAAVAQEETLDDLSLEELLSLDLEVTSVSKRAEALADSAAAVYAITQEELRRTGHTSIAEALRVVPGVHVARFDSSAWAISARSFNGRFNNKMLLQLDGRSAYTPLFGGVFWDVQDTFLDDIERIEVIRGPGGTLWGANAVNGVINVTTRSSSKTRGLFAYGSAGVEERFGGGARFGGAIGEGLFYRVYAKYREHDGGSDFDERPTHDAWSAGRGGFRVDWERAAGTTVTIQGDAYSNREETGWVRDTLVEPYSELVEDVTPASGANVIARWTRTLGESSRLQAQAYWDHTSRDDVRGGEVRDTGDVDVQWHSKLGEHRLIAGAGVRSTTNEWEDRPALQMDPDRQTDVLLNLYVQDEMRFFQDALRVTVGSKFEHNEFTGFELQPNARVTLRPTENQTVWAAASRAVRTPNRVNRDSIVAFDVFVANPPLYVVVVGNPDLKSEVLYAYEAGYRVSAFERLSVDLAGFYNQYDDLIVVNSANAGDPYLGEDGESYLPVPWTNEENASIRGAELAARFEVTPQWVIATGYSYIDPSFVATNADLEGATPTHQATMRWYMNVTDSLEWNIAGYYISETRGERRIPPLGRLDMGFTARVSKNLEVSGWGQNLLAEHHAEVENVFLFPSTRVDRSFYARLTTRW